MKKKTFRALKEAYYNELKKIGVIDTPKVKTYQEMTKAELIEEGKALGIDLDMKLTKAEMIASIECHNEPVEEVVVEVEEEIITEEEVQAVANAIVEQAEEDNKTIEDVVNEIVEEGKEGV